MRTYEIVEHTADVGIRAWGKDPKELFAHMAEGMLDLMVPLHAVEEKQSHRVCVEARDWESLLVAWLKALLYLFDTQHFVGKRIEFSSLTPTQLDSVVWGEPLDLLKHPVGKEVKAVTYCDLTVRQESDGTWYAQVIFDV
jgi:SHS2 domain-containing protein